MTATHIERVTVHQVDQDDESYRVELLHLANGDNVAYRVDPSEAGGSTFTPAKASVAEALARITEDG